MKFTKLVQERFGLSEAEWRLLPTECKLERVIDFLGNKVVEYEALLGMEEVGRLFKEEYSMEKTGLPPIQEDFGLMMQKQQAS